MFGIRAVGSVWEEFLVLGVGDEQQAKQHGHRLRIRLLETFGCRIAVLGSQRGSQAWYSIEIDAVTEPSPKLGDKQARGFQDLFDGTGCSMINQTQGSVDLLTLFASFASGAGSSSDDTASSSEDDFGGYPE